MSNLEDSLKEKQAAEQKFIEELYVAASNETERVLSGPRRKPIKNSELLMEVRESVGSLLDYYPVRKGHYDYVLQAAINDEPCNGPLGPVQFG